MKIRKILFLIISICCVNYSTIVSYGVEPDEILKNQNQELRARHISKNIRCMICQNQSIDESNAPLAKDLRILIRKKIKEGQKDKEIYKFLSDRYGDFILLKPAVQFTTLALWLLPFLFLVAGVFIIFYHNKKSKNISN